MASITRLNEYQAAAMATAGDLLSRRAEEGIVTAALGLAGEAGEFADHVKKWWAQGHDLDLDKLDKEAGDVLWYLARYAEARGKWLSELATLNIEKLAARYAASGGVFDPGISKARYAKPATDEELKMCGAGTD